jgi:hypothetical protein
MDLKDEVICGLKTHTVTAYKQSKGKALYTNHNTQWHRENSSFVTDYNV